MTTGLDRSLFDRPITPDEVQALARHDLAFYTSLMFPKFRAAHHHQRICDVLNDVAAGKKKRVILTMPPRHGKSILASQHFPPWYIGKHPDREVICATYSQDKADDWGREVRNQVIDPMYGLVFPGVTLRKDSTAARRFKTPQQGGYFAAGRNSPMTGRGASCLPGWVLVATVDGPRRIDEIVAATEPCYVLAYDQAAAKVRRRRVVAFQQKESPDYYRVCTAAGRMVEATGDHRILTGRGWVRADDLAPGDRVVCLVRGVGDPASLRDQEIAEEGPDRVCLRAGLLQPHLEPGAGARSEGVRAMPSRVAASGGADQHVLLAAVRGGREGAAGAGQDDPWCSARATAPQAVRVLQPDIPTQDHEDAGAFLLARLQRQGARTGDAGRREPWLAARHGLEAEAKTFGAGVPRHEAADTGARQLLLRDLSARGGAPRAWANGGSPYRPRRHEQPLGQPRDALRMSSPDAARGGQIETEPDTVAVVERVREPVAVFDIQVEGDHNFFAAGVCVHNCLIVDDILKGDEEADSARIREKVKNWWGSVAYTRLTPDGAIVLIGTRWHDDDLIGFVTREHADENWEVLDYPAINAQGEALWPERFPVEHLRKIRRALTDRHWNALYQQKPYTEEGAILKRHFWRPWLRPLESTKPEYVVISLDTAYTKEKQNDRTACTVWWVVRGDDDRARFLLRYAWAERLEFNELMVKLEDTIAHFSRGSAPLRVLIEAKASGLSVVQELRRRQPHLSVLEVPATTDKFARAYSVQTFMEHGSVCAVAKLEPRGVRDVALEKDFPGRKDDRQEEPVFRPWAQECIDECAIFPRGKHDDYLDSVTHGLRHLRDLGFELFVEDDPPPVPADAGLEEALY